MQCRWLMVMFFKQKTAYEMRISDWSSDVCSSDLAQFVHIGLVHACLHTEHARKSVRRMAVQNDHNARSCLSNDLHGTRQELTARSFLTQQVSEGRELMHADRKSTRLNSSH